MVTFLTIVALLALLAVVIGIGLWFAAHRDNAVTSTAGYAGRAHTGLTIAFGGLAVWAIVTIILGVIALVDAWT